MRFSALLLVSFLALSPMAAQTTKTASKKAQAKAPAPKAADINPTPVAQTNIGESFSKAALQVLILINTFYRMPDKVDEALSALKIERAPIVVDGRVSPQGMKEMHVYDSMIILSTSSVGQRLPPDCVSDVSAQLHARYWIGLKGCD